MKRMSIDERLLVPHEASPTTRRFNIADLKHLSVAVAELRYAPERKRWQYALNVSFAGRQWQVCKRYSEIREFWDSLRALLAENQHSCTERCHFLAGCEDHKFPKKRLLHTRSVLEQRANALESFFTSLTMRLNLCDRRALARCHFDGCTTLALITSFFEIQAQFKTSGAHVYHTMRAYHSMPLPVPKNRTKDERQTYHGRLSLATLQEVRVA